MTNILFDEHFKEDEEYRYYNAVLRNIFFHCLNTAMPDRKNLEYKKLIKNIRPFKEQFDKIPFLNGGIFNQHEGDEVPLSNDFFFSELQTRRIRELGGNYKVAGLVRILMQYHYKLSLDALLDREYAETVDPEFIGKVFESLLACIEAESQVSRRKITGSFYTPNEVVDYMVCGALDMYLEQSRNRKIAQQESQSYDCGSDENTYLLQCRILDPSCGSGAFPCGIMNEIMRRLDPHRILPQWERYRKKLEILQKVIYGVDIQPMAVQISQLRLFLSLIQEIVPEKRKPNYGIQPLPNLETKFVCADALLALKKEDHKGQRTLELRIVREKVKQLAETRSQYFMASGVLEKERLRRYDESLRATLGLAMEESGELAHDTAEKLAQWDPYNASRSVPFFDSVWMFGIEKFDIIIGNPPYIQLQKRNSALVKRYEHCGFETFERTGDIYCLFYERAWQLLQDEGLLCFVTSNKWMRAGYDESLRKFLSEKTNPILLLDLSGIKVFESSTVDVNILLYSKEANRHQTAASAIEKITDLKRANRNKRIKKDNTMSFTTAPWVSLSPIELRIKKKIEAIGTPLKDWNITINYGIKTGYNDAFIIDGKKKDELIAVDPKTVVSFPSTQVVNLTQWRR